MRNHVCVLLVAVLASCTREDPPYGPGTSASTSPTLAITGTVSAALGETLLSLVASNLNTLPSREPDSDADGISDGDEAILGTLPLNRDSDGDGLGDGLEFQLGSPPLRASVPCLDLTDADGDALNACEERLLGTRPDAFDTDGDGLSDGLEAQAGTDPALEDPGTDYDFDGVTNEDEVLRHTQARRSSDRDVPYRYRVTDSGVATFQFRVAGMTLAPLLNEAPNMVVLTTGWATPLGTVYRVACVRLSLADLPRFAEVDLAEDAWVLPQDLRPALCACPAGGC